jgi:peptidoglycan L-alanyl-D-glutamate endopeptidase CwlK
MASREIGDLSIKMQILYNRHNDRVRRDPWFQQRGISMLLICTYRSDEEQAKLYDQGRRLPGPIVTNAKPGKSKHNCKDPQGNPAAEAYDVVPIYMGKPVWASKDDPSTPENELEIWRRIGQHGVDVGLKWYGAPDAPFREFPHFQNPDA